MCIVYNIKWTKKKKKEEEDDDKILCALVFNSKVNNIIKLRLSQFAIKKKDFNHQIWYHIECMRR